MTKKNLASSKGGVSSFGNLSVAIGSSAVATGMHGVMLGSQSFPSRGVVVENEFRTFLRMSDLSVDEIIKTVLPTSMDPNSPTIQRIIYEERPLTKAQRILYEKTTKNSK